MSDSTTLTMSDSTTLTNILNAINDANELERERIEILQKDSEANRSENRDIRATLEAQQSALAALQSVSTKTAQFFGKNLNSDSDHNLSSDDELNLSKLE